MLTQSSGGGGICAGWVKRKLSGGISLLTGNGFIEAGPPTSERAENLVMSDGGLQEGGRASDEDVSGPGAMMSKLFGLPFFAPLVSKHLPDEMVVRLGSCNSTLNCILAPEIGDIEEKRRREDAGRVVPRNKAPDAFELLLCLTRACVQSCAFGTMRPLEVYITKVAYGPNGYHSDAVGYTSLGDIFEFVNDSEDWEGVFML